MLKNIKALLLDLDGTLYFKKKVVPGAQASIETLRSMGYTLRFLTNTDTKSIRTLHNELCDYGITVEEKEIFTPAVAALDFIKEKKGVNVFSLVSNELMEYFSPYKAIHGQSDYVIIGDFRDKVSYELINEAFRHIDAGADIIALQTSGYFYGPEGKNVDTGAFVSLFEYASGKKATLMGKPSSNFFMTAINQMELHPNEVGIVGDDLTTDIKGACNVGAVGILVKTGKYQDQVMSEKSDIKPEYIINSIENLPELLGKSNI